MAKIGLVPGEILSIFKITSFALSIKMEIIVIEEQEERIVYKTSPKAKKKYGFSKNENETVMLRGETDIHTDYSHPGCNAFRGNACLNIISSRPHNELREIFDNSNLLDMKDYSKAKIIVYSLEQARDLDFEATVDNLLYPDIDCYCAPLEKIKNRQQA